MLLLEVKNIGVLLRDNGYLESIIGSEISNKVARFQSLSKFGLKKRKQQPTKILPERKCKIRSMATNQKCFLAIGLHLMQNSKCATQYSNDQLSILAKASYMFCLSILEAIYMKISKPIFCHQKEFVYSLKVFH